jgi:competence protein ComEA
VPTVSRVQLAVYAAIGVVLLLLGVRAVRESGGEADAATPGVRLSSAPVGSDGGGAAASGGDLVVHVTGEVEEPGVYRLPAGSRVAAALDRAGGASGKGDPNAINLAARLADGQQVVVPAKAGSPAAATAAAVAEDAPISLGSADQADLETIEGIGPVTAADILAYRDEHGGISSIDELDEVPGIGPATLESLRDRLQP